MDAESIRDSLLAASGRLDRTLYGLSVAPYREKPNEDRRLFSGPLDGDGRRSVYIKVRLMEGDKFLTGFNFPGSKVTQGRRDVTNVPAQALALLNDPFVIQQAGVWSERMCRQEQDTRQLRIETIFRQALGRPPTEGETHEFDQLVDQLANLYGIPPENVMSDRALWKDVAHVMFNLKEFTFVP